MEAIEKVFEVFTPSVPATRSSNGIAYVNFWIARHLKELQGFVEVERRLKVGASEHRWVVEFWKVPNPR